MLAEKIQSNIILSKNNVVNVKERICYTVQKQDDGKTV